MEIPQFVTGSAAITSLVATLVLHYLFFHEYRIGEKDHTDYAVMGLIAVQAFVMVFITVGFLLLLLGVELETGYYFRIPIQIFFITNIATTAGLVILRSELKTLRTALKRFVNGSAQKKEKRDRQE